MKESTQTSRQARGKKIIIATPFTAEGIGGPAKYAQGIAGGLKNRGYDVEIISFAKVKKFPTIIRHILFMISLMRAVRSAEYIIALDGMSVGSPAVFVGKLFKKKVVVRLGGDFLWETYVEQTKRFITLEEFYREMPKLSFKQDALKKMTQDLLKNAHRTAFNSAWFRDVFVRSYNIPSEKVAVIRNYFDINPSNQPFIAGSRYLFTARPIVFKNKPLAEEALVKLENESIEIFSGNPEEAKKKIAGCRAVVVPSMTEINSNTVLEALSYGKPFIMTKYHGMDPFFESYGLIIDPRSSEELMRAIYMMNNDIWYDAMCRKIQNLSVSHTWQQIADEFLELCKS